MTVRLSKQLCTGPVVSRAHCIRHCRGRSRTAATIMTKPEPTIIPERFRPTTMWSLWAGMMIIRRKIFRSFRRITGAFLCENSWGTGFGEAGFFYVSYYDTNLCTTNLLYSDVEPADNYDRIYQTDLCGWLGQIGYGNENVWGANVYTASAGMQQICAAGFYAVDADTEYEIGIVTDVPDQPAADWRHLKQKKLGTVSGTVPYAGYYTIPLAEPVKVKPGERFAVTLKLHTPGAVHPMAIEYDSGDGRCLVDITDGEGYLSADGDVWERVETEQECNLCLKAYTVMQ